jgi:diamine N-acetyltransferase
MITLKGTNIYLRALEPEDLEFVYAIENNESFWEVSNTQTPYSRFLIRQYLENAHQDIYEAKQFRLAICLNDSQKPIGLIDLFDFDPKNSRSGVGLVIADLASRNKGIGSEALELIINYSFQQLQLHQLYANIGSDNEISLQLFTKFGFQKIGIKKDWNRVQNCFKDELLFQLIQ